MPSYRGISISLQSQYDARTIPEWPPPFVTASPSPKRDDPESSISTFKAPSAESHTAEVYIPIYRGSQLWINYTGPDPRDTSCPETKYYYFKLFIGGKCLLSWGVGEEDNWSGRVTFGIFDGGSDFEGRKVLEKRSLFFPKDEYENGCAGFEIRVFRSQARRRENASYHVYQGADVRQSGLLLTKSGRMMKGEPRRMYAYALIDPKDEPYATFRYQCRSSLQLFEMGVDMNGADDLDSVIGAASSSDHGSPGDAYHASPPAPAVPNDELSRANRLSFPPRLKLAPSALLSEPQSPARKKQQPVKPVPRLPEEEFEVMYLADKEPKGRAVSLKKRSGNRMSLEAPTGPEKSDSASISSGKVSMTDSLRGLRARFKRPSFQDFARESSISKIAIVNALYRYTMSTVKSPSNSATGVEFITQKNPDDVIITLAIRTPLAKAKKGGLKDTPLDALCFRILQLVRERSNLDPALVEDICLGNVRESRAAYYVRAAALAAGFPATTAASSTARFCSSGLTATQHIADAIATDEIEIGIAVGAESLTHFTGQRLDRDFVSEIMEGSQEARDCMYSMGETSEIVGEEFGVTRKMQDEYAVESYRRAEMAQKAGWFDDEIAPTTVMLDGKEVVLTKDDVRYGTKYEKLAKLPASFPPGDKSTAGNSSQVTDGAAALLLMKRSKALELGQPIVGKYVGSAIAGLPPRIMGIGPVYAIPKLLSRFNLSLSQDIDVVEINEAFASMAVYCRDHLDLKWENMNPRGGAIAIGHPFGCTGIRQITSGLSECRRRKQRILLTSMCMGTGMAMAGLFINEQL